MEPFRIHILGCGSALPTLQHAPSCQVVEIRGKYFMIDCGECAQIQLRKSGINFMKISILLISHLHGDHCFGVIGFISTLGMLGRIAPLHVYATPEYENILRAQINFFCKGLEFEVVFHPVVTTEHKVIYEDRSLTIESIPLEHRINCCGFLFKEKESLPHIRKDMIDFYRIPHYAINSIKNGVDWVTEEGETISASKLTIPANKGRSYAYCSDTKYLPQLYKLITNSSVLYHESTYEEQHKTFADKYFHSTAKQAATVAKDAKVGTLLLGHYSSRYKNETTLLNEAKEIFPNTSLTIEGMVFDVK